jgi:hypothetical protein
MHQIEEKLNYDNEFELCQHITQYMHKDNDKLIKLCHYLKSLSQVRTIKLGQNELIKIFNYLLEIDRPQIVVDWIQSKNMQINIINQQEILINALEQLGEISEAKKHRCYLIDFCLKRKFYLPLFKTIKESNEKYSNEISFILYELVSLLEINDTQNALITYEKIRIHLHRKNLRQYKKINRNLIVNELIDILEKEHNIDYQLEILLIELKLLKNYLKSDNNNFFNTRQLISRYLIVKNDDPQSLILILKNIYQNEYSALIQELLELLEKNRNYSFLDYINGDDDFKKIVLAHRDYLRKKKKILETRVNLKFDSASQLNTIKEGTEKKMNLDTKKILKQLHSELEIEKDVITSKVDSDLVTYMKSVEVTGEFAKDLLIECINQKLHNSIKYIIKNYNNIDKFVLLQANRVLGNWGEALNLCDELINNANEEQLKQFLNIKIDLLDALGLKKEVAYLKEQYNKLK